MARNVGRYIPLLLLVCYSGCASIFDAKTPPGERLDRECERVFAKRWDRLRLSAKDFPPPEVTPYDTTNSLRKAYFEGYAEGVDLAIKIRGYGGLWLRLAENDTHAACIQGWKDGRYAVFLKADGMREQVDTEISKDSPKAYDYPRRRGVLFYLPRIPLIQPRWEKRSCYPDGRVKSIQPGYYARGHQLYHGTSEEFYPDGKIMSRTECRHGECHGIDRQWYPNGQLEQEAPFYRDGLHGVFKRWHDNGQRDYEVTWVHGQQHGLSTDWNEDGTLNCVEIYTNGVLVADDPQEKTGRDLSERQKKTLNTQSNEPLPLFNGNKY